MDKQMRRDKRCMSFAIFIFSVLLLSSCAFAQCDDCDDKNPCTKDLCEAATCQHIPQSCDNANFAAGVSLGSGANSTPKSVEIPVQKPQAPSATNEAVNIPANCDDNNPCTRDSYGANGCVHDPVNCDDENPCTTDSCGANGCVHDPVNCDDGNASTTDQCGSSGCINTPLIGESGKTDLVQSPTPIESEIKNECRRREYNHQ